jgi:hypothetical protein
MTRISLQPLATRRMIGMRAKAVPLRDKIESALQDGEEVVLDFAGIEATQSFIDELVGVLLLTKGPSLLERIVFSGCSENVRAILRFVASDRCNQFSKVH